MKKIFLLKIVLAVVLCVLIARTAPPITAQVLTQTFTPQEIPLSSSEILNPERSYYKWRGNTEQFTDFAPAQLAYERFNWRELETSQGVYDFSPIEKLVVQANNENRKFSFRIRDLVPADGIAVPDYIKPYGFWYSGFFVPDYNNSFVQQRRRALLMALGQKYNNDPRIAYQDIGMYGKFGEWHVSNISYPSGFSIATDASLKKIVDDYVDAFPDMQLVMMHSNPKGANAVIYAMNHPRVKIPIGVRNDCLGLLNNKEHFRDMLIYPQWDSMKDRWIIAPIVTEYCADDGIEYAYAQVRDYHVSLLSNGNAGKNLTLYTQSQIDSAKKAGKISGYRYVLRSLQLPSQLNPGNTFAITSTWSNVGVAPAYWPWQVRLQLRTPGTTSVVWQGFLSSIHLKCLSLSDALCLLPTYNYTTSVDIPKKYTDSLTLASNIPQGTYEVAIKITSSDSKWSVLKLANQGKTSDNAYLLGKVSVAAGSPPETIATATVPPATATQPPATATHPPATVTKSGKQTCPQDLDGNATIDLRDYSLFVRYFSTNDVANGDLNGDGKVDLSDYTAVVTKMLKKC